VGYMQYQMLGEGHPLITRGQRQPLLSIEHSYTYWIAASEKSYWLSGWYGIGRGE